MKPLEYYSRTNPHHPGLRFWGEANRLHAHNSACLNDAYLNTSSGHIYIDEDSLCAQDVMILTGTHFEHPEGGRAKRDFPTDGRDIIIENHVFIGSRAIILANNDGPRIIGHHSVIGAGAVVTKDVEPYAFVAGNPAKFIKYIFKA